MKKTSQSLLIFLSILFLDSCFGRYVEPTPNPKEGYRPIYAIREQVEKITLEAPRKMVNPGKIYVKGDILFVNEINAGIHVFNNSNKSKPVAVAFISILGNVDIAVKENTLYADNVTDLVAIDISSPTAIKVTKRVKNLFAANTQNFPPYRNTYFECVDEKRGVVIGWEKYEIKDQGIPNCRR
jgi:LVIVD repeat